MSFRVTSYHLTNDNTGFSGASFTLTLNNDLSEHYFAIVESAGAGTGANSASNPDDNLARITGDPFGDLGTTTASNELQLRRSSTVNNWQGVVTVVECIDDYENSGFRLLGVAEITGTGTGLSGSFSHEPADDASNVSYFLGGTLTSQTSPANHNAGAFSLSRLNGTTGQWARLFGGGSSAADGEATVYAIEWGAEWTVGEASDDKDPVSGGSPPNVSVHMNVIPVTSVDAESTFVYMMALSDDNGLADGPFSAIYGLGDGVNLPTGATNEMYWTRYTGGDRNIISAFLITHPLLKVEHIIGTGSSNTFFGMATGNAQAGPWVIGDNGGGSGEVYGSTGAVDWSEGVRGCLLYTSPSPRDATLSRMPSSA